MGGATGNGRLEVASGNRLSGDFSQQSVWASLAELLGHAQVILGN